jgi:hypothetical protein
MKTLILIHLLLLLGCREPKQKETSFTPIVEHSQIPNIDTIAVVSQLKSLTVNALIFKTEATSKYTHGIELVLQGRTKEALKIEKWYNTVYIPKQKLTLDTINDLKHLIGWDKNERSAK